jgi:exopolyphosphatase/guanosine-5'-triphosphate,3'-diphosphate pyrophosphatase
MLASNLSLPDTVAAVDLGSNSFHLIVARPTPGELLVLEKFREMVQLAAGLNESRRLSKDAQARALDCLRRFHRRLRRLPAHAIRAVGTNTLRTAKNAREFLIKAEGVLGHPIETVSGIEEARLIYLGVTQSLVDPSGRRIVLDIGGGSTEVIIGEDREPLEMASLSLGCVTMSRAFFGDGEISPARWRQAELAALREFESLRMRFRSIGWTEAVGASGTIRAAHAVARAEGWSQEGITPRALKRMRDSALKAGRIDRWWPGGLNPGRRPVFPGGVVVLCAAFETLGIERMRTAEGALREGVLVDLLDRIQGKGVRSRSVALLADRFRVDLKQAARVEQTALHLLAQVSEDWALASREARYFLSWAAMVHEIGLDLAQQQYHKRGAYLIQESDLLGFSREEQRVLAALVRAHRRKFPVSALEALPPHRRRQAERLAIMLRLAVILHRSRGDESIAEPKFEVDGKSLKLRFRDRWLDEQPLRSADLQEEKAFLSAAGYRLKFT